MAVVFKKIAYETDVVTKAILTTKGDIFVATGSATPVRRGVGADDTVLTADSAQASGVKWATVAGAGDMLKSTYDTDGDGVVDNSEKLEASTKAQVQDHTPKAHTLTSHSTKAHSELSDAPEGAHHTKFTTAEHSAIGNGAPHHTKYTDANARTAAVEDAAYGAGWNGDTTHAPSQNAVYDKIETLGAGVSFTELAGVEYKNVTGVDAWEDWDISGIVPAGTTCVLVSVQNIQLNSSHEAGARKNGGGLDRPFGPRGMPFSDILGRTIAIMLTEVDANRVIEIYSGEKFQVFFGIKGYWS